MTGLPSVPMRDGIKKSHSIKFGGYNHTLGAGDGEIYDMINMTSDYYPLLAPRRARWQIATLTKPNGMYCHDGIYYVDGTSFCKVGVTNPLGTVTDSQKKMISLGNYIVILPDKKYYYVGTTFPARLNNQEFGSLEATATSISCSIQDGTIYDEAAVANTIYCNASGHSWLNYFAPGDAIEISGASDTNNNKTIVVREVTATDLRFYENSFALTTNWKYTVTDKLKKGTYYFTIEGHKRNFTTTTDYTNSSTEPTVSNELVWDSTNSTLSMIVTTGGTPATTTLNVADGIAGDKLTFTSYSVPKSETLTLKRTVPDMDYICENENRLWGCKDDTIYASKLGDPFNWQVYETAADASYAVDVGSAGRFTGCCSYLGYPVFFKEEQIYKVYGDNPANYQVMPSASLGIEEGSWNSPAIAGEILFYLARSGVVAYTGGIPQNVAAPFGTDRYKNAVGGSDGVKYYVSMQDTSDGWHLFVFDTRSNMWHREDSLHVIDFGWDGELYFLDSAGKIWLNGNCRTHPDTGCEADSEHPLESMAMFSDFVDLHPKAPAYGANRKGTAKIQIRLGLGANAEVTVKMLFDGDGEETDEDWVTVKTLTNVSHTKRSYYLPIVPRRSDHYRVKLEGKGMWWLYSLVREDYQGSELLWRS